LKYFPEGDMHLSQPIVQKGTHILQPFREEALTLISNAPKKGMTSN
jgi:hypothetical protein